ncbi:MotA/TolQ/ExbB proton channel family protein [Parasphingorhabdus cellanae]|uniref:MotA/TolQ/ExbB proton channel family protein n=1 Tax=Parasphingorhabdus cellanae TaxID=2806553 RepID=A0ABX7SZN8_9SPHN|nr:MotA/TolQ/ExbB proton channel family protein [Parasphingorhabdus cellanae]QTD54739.1 MotA/TolQ/ExbB proton channel family protein [Parasphingorhabdus cellanae]
MVAAKIAPENKFAFDHPPEPDVMIWFVLAILMAIFVSMLVIFAKNMTTNSKSIKLKPERYALWTSYLKTASICSLLIGLIGSLIGVYRTLIKMAMFEVYNFEGSIGPIGEALIFLIIGIAIAFLGYGLEFIGRWKGVAAMNK